MARKCKCKICKNELTTDVAYCNIVELENGKKRNVYYCSKDEYGKEQDDKHYWRESQYLTDEILGYPIINNNRNKMMTDILSSGYSREELYDCIKEIKGYIGECLTYRADIESEHGKLCYMFAIIKGSIRDITDRNRKDKKQQVNNVLIQDDELIDEVEIQVSNIRVNKRKSLLDRLEL